ncbi:MAG: SMP-30/gluconolactonase/LRE family protein [Microcoleaceae cyanobacterium MO_207.B10]|nr:SMP-30/gluconolactonase/LRE family protein [Microcoleaceae cyanobacterium MO_207.B10]
MPTIIADYQCHNAEVPIWHSMEQCLYWADIPTGRMFRYYPTTDSHEQIYQGEPIGGITIQTDGALLLFMNKGAIMLRIATASATWQAGQLIEIANIPAETDSRFNDCIADPCGRVFTGTISTSNHPGSLYRLDTDGTITKVLTGLEIPNGMGFTPDRKQMYFTDSPQRKIYIFDYDQTTGNLSNQRVFITTPENEGVPDGMTVDAEGCIWSARWDGGHLFRYTPDGKEVLRIPFPAKKVSCVTFGGADYTDMYVTTAGGDKREVEGSGEGSGAGAVFRLNIGIQGVPEFMSKVQV